MKFILTLILAFILSSCNSSKNSNASSTSSPDAQFMGLELGVMRHYGKPSGYGITLKEFMEIIVRKDASKEWEKNGESSWILKAKIDDAAAEVTHNLTYVFEKSEKQAVITRFIANGEETQTYHLGRVMDQLISPWTEKIISERKK